MGKHIAKSSSLTPISFYSKKQNGSKTSMLGLNSCTKTGDEIIEGYVCSREKLKAHTKGMTGNTMVENSLL